MKPEWLEAARWVVTVALLAYAVMLSVKARSTRKECDWYKLTNKAFRDLLKDSEEEVNSLRNHLYVARQKLHEPTRFNYDLTKAPAGHLQLLTVGGARLIEPLGSVKRAQEMGIVAWAPAANRDKQEEIRLGLVPPP